MIWQWIKDLFKGLKVSCSFTLPTFSRKNDENKQSTKVEKNKEKGMAG